MAKHIITLFAIITAVLVFMDIAALTWVKVIVVLSIIIYYVIAIYPGKDSIKKFIDEKFK